MIMANAKYKWVNLMIIVITAVYTIKYAGAALNSIVAVLSVAEIVVIACARPLE